MSFVEFLSEVLPILLYLGGIVLIVLLIIISIKLIKTMNKIEEIVLEVDSRIKKITKFLSIFDIITDKISTVTDKTADFISKGIKKVFNKKERKD